MRLCVLQVGKYYPPYMGGIETVLGDLTEVLRDEYDVRVLVCSHVGRFSAGSAPNRRWSHVRVTMRMA